MYEVISTIFTSDNRYNGMLPLVVNITSSNTTYEWCLHTCLLEDCPAFFFGNSQCYVRRERISVHFRYVPGMSYYERTGALGNVAIRGNTEASFTPCDSCKEATSGARLTTTYPPIDRDPCFTTPITSDNPYILITLWRKVFVAEVAILTREDGPPESGDQFFGIIIVYVQDDAGEWKLCTSLSGSGGFGKMFNQKCRAPLIAGQVVKVYKYHLDCLLSLCEVEIYGYI
ncbi:uncharacterized protein [Argopecten irradians]|uniref:uncharacterized protein n=1 Tax=Argopecten irradians TaxID=31199 RepID=UPI00371931B3